MTDKGTSATSATSATAVAATIDQATVNNMVAQAMAQQQAALLDAINDQMRKQLELYFGPETTVQKQTREPNKWFAVKADNGVVCTNCHTAHMVFSNAGLGRVMSVCANPSCSHYQDPTLPANETVTDTSGRVLVAA